MQKDNFTVNSKEIYVKAGKPKSKKESNKKKSKPKKKQKKQNPTLTSLTDSN